jgi:oxygen-independent coproporphyrinogen-3 oxidase
MPIETLKLVNDVTPKIIAGLIADQMIEPAAALSGRLVLTLKGRLLADSIVRQFLA